jgi:hypothetical protein
MFSAEICVLQMKKSVKKRVRKYGKANRCRNPRNWFTSLSKSEAYRQCGRVESTVADFHLGDFSSCYSRGIK